MRLPWGRKAEQEDRSRTDPVDYVTAEYVNGNIDVEEFERRVGSYMLGEPVIPPLDPEEAARNGTWVPTPLSAGNWLGSAMDQDREAKARGIQH